MERIRDVLRDAALSLALGCAIGAAAGVVMLVLGTLAGGGVEAGLTAARSGLMLTGAFVLLFSAGLFLRGDRLPEDAFRLGPRQRGALDDSCGPGPLPGFFRVLRRKYTALLIGIGILLVSGVADGLIRQRP